MILFFVFSALSFLATYKMGYYAGRLDELKDTKAWLNKLLEEAEERQAMKHRVIKQWCRGCGAWFATTAAAREHGGKNAK